MALIKCPECGKEVSDRAKACIHCGYPLAEIAHVEEVLSVEAPITDENRQTTSKETDEGIEYNSLALMYQNGFETSPDYLKAEEYFLKAIELGSEAAKRNYALFANNRGVAYAYGTGVEKDYSKAEEYYLKAIKYGNEQAQRNYDALKKLKEQPILETPSSSSQHKKSGSGAAWLLVVICAILFLLFRGIIGGGDDDRDPRTCAWCGGTGYSANGAQSVEDYVFKKTPCKHCGGDGEY